MPAEPAMETIGALEARERFHELLDRVARGESFRIIRDGRPVGMIVPPDSQRDPRVVADAVERLKAFRGALAGMNRENIAGLRHEGHRA